MVDNTMGRHRDSACPQVSTAGAGGWMESEPEWNGGVMRRIRWQSFVQGLVVAVAFSSGVALAAGPLPFSEEWYQQRVDDPPAARQVVKHGKYWPPYPRPMGRKQTFSHTYHAAHYWPFPYNCQDRADVQNLLDAQANAGWVTATTLHDYHFDVDTQKLTDAGQNHLLWVMNAVPAQYRTVYVSQGTSAEMAQLRIANGVGWRTLLTEVRHLRIDGIENRGRDHDAVRHRSSFTPCFLANRRTAVRASCDRPAFRSALLRSIIASVSAMSARSASSS